MFSLINVSSMYLIPQFLAQLAQMPKSLSNHELSRRVSYGIVVCDVVCGQPFQTHLIIEILYCPHTCINLRSIAFPKLGQYYILCWLYSSVTFI